MSWAQLLALADDTVSAPAATASESGSSSNPWDKAPAQRPPRIEASGQPVTIVVTRTNYQQPNALRPRDPVHVHRIARDPPADTARTVGCPDPLFCRCEYPYGKVCNNGSLLANFPV